MANNEIARNSKYMVPETKAYHTPYDDYFFTGFKFMVDYSKPCGLFADEEHTDSALNYLSRIGEVERYDLLKKFINNWKVIHKDFEHLLMKTDGVGGVYTQGQVEQFYTDNGEMTLVYRETVDLKIMSLINAYRYIWFDDVRGVEVLPSNLREFDCVFVTYQRGYYLMDLYDQDNILPTLRKVSENLIESCN